MGPVGKQPSSYHYHSEVVESGIVEESSKEGECITCLISSSHSSDIISYQIVKNYSSIYKKLFHICESTLLKCFSPAFQIPLTLPFSIQYCGSGYGRSISRMGKMDPGRLKKNEKIFPLIFKFFKL